MSDSSDITNIVIEALEVVINQVLYIRQVYPAQVFQKRRIYNTPIHISVYPPLNTYLHNVLRTARELLHNKELQCLEIMLYKEMKCEEVVEQYMLHVHTNSTVNSVEDAFLLKFEQDLRTCLYKMVMRLKPLPPLPNSIKFKLLLHTNETGFTRISHNSQYQDFPWLQSTINRHNCESSKKNTLSLLPLTAVSSIGLQFEALLRKH